MKLLKGLRRTAGALLLMATAGTAGAEVRSEVVTYRDGDTELKGFLAWDERFTGARPGVLIAHEWWGLNDHVKERARMLAREGYIALAADMYGDGRIAEHREEAGAWMQQITENTARWRRRAEAALAALRAQARVDPARLAAIGFCFGGATAMQLAYTGADLKAVVSFHGSLPLPEAGEAERIRGSVLALHGHEDSFVPPERVAAFETALEEAGVDWQLVTFGGTRHAFTNPDADRHGMENLRYNARSDRRAWRYMLNLFEEQLGG